MTKEDALKLALEALETELCIDWTNVNESEAAAEKMHEAIAAIKEALAQPVQPQRQWVGLTDEEVNWFGWHGTGIRTIEAKLKEKNCG